jgi:hypothetical protein
VPLSGLRLGADVPDPGDGFAARLGIEPDGAVLVRPDQHVAWRSVRGAASPGAALAAAFAGILGR